MAAGFHIPSFMVETDASGLQLVHWVRGVWGSRDPDADPSEAVVKLAAWLLADRTRIGTLESGLKGWGLGIADVLANRMPVTPALARAISEISGCRVGLHDWTRPHSDAGIVPHAIPAALDAGGREQVQPVPPASLPPRIVLLDEGMLPDVAMVPIVHGRLGETPPGRLFRVIRGEGSAPYVLTGLGCSWALTHADALGMLAELANALKVRIAGADDGAAA
jgi:hypothetical protein